ncbi:MAG: hypothetical protein IPL90_02475 [Holophagales bacterium]|nr:hypothetical protein [Holophagales bacterium]
MDGGDHPIRDGDWVVLRWARGEALKNLHYSSKPALIENRDVSGEAGYQLKRVVREEGRWLLRSNNPEMPDFEATEETRPIAVLQQVIRPEDLAPSAGDLIQEASLASAFGLDESPREGHVGGPSLLLRGGTRAFKAPDRLARPASGRPGETAFVLTRSARRSRGATAASDGGGPTRVSGRSGARLCQAPLKLTPLRQQS